MNYGLWAVLSSPIYTSALAGATPGTQIPTNALLYKIDQSPGRAGAIVQSNANVVCVAKFMANGQTALQMIPQATNTLTLVTNSLLALGVADNQFANVQDVWMGTNFLTSSRSFVFPCPANGGGTVLITPYTPQAITYRVWPHDCFGATLSQFATHMISSGQSASPFFFDEVIDIPTAGAWQIEMPLHDWCTNAIVKIKWQWSGTGNVTYTNRVEPLEFADVATGADSQGRNFSPFPGSSYNAIFTWTNHIDYLSYTTSFYDLTGVQKIFMIDNGGGIGNPSNTTSHIEFIWADVTELGSAPAALTPKP
jgi:hypothetical protein